MVTILSVLVGCFVKKEDPELLIPPPDYDAEVLEQSGYRLCIDAHPTDATVMVSSRSISDCVEVKGEVFVEVSHNGYAPYRELLSVNSDVTHQVILVPVLPEPSIPAVSIPEMNTPQTDEGVPKMNYPMPQQKQAPAAFQQTTSIELCVSTVPEDAYVRINGMKRTSGSCMRVQTAAEVRVEADGYVPYKKLISLPIDQSEPFQHMVILQKTKKSEPAEY